MEFKNRQATNPGRVTLKNVSTGATTTYDLTMADGATEQGTPLNKATMDALKEDILNEVQSKLDGTFVPCCTTVAVEYFNADGVPVRVSLSKTSSHI